MSLGYLGPAGTFTEQAARQWLGARSMGLSPYNTISEVLQSVGQQHCTYGIVPIENSLEGAVNHTLDTLLKTPYLHIREEYVLRIQQNLLAMPGTKLEDIEEVWSHPQALAQCRRFLESRGVRTKHYVSTARAAEAVRSGNVRRVAAVGSLAAAEAFGLDILASGIEDAGQNDTRFVIVGRTPLNPSDATKTMLVIRPCREQAGVLAAILHVFASYQLNLSWIESRPTKHRLGMYQFFMDIECSLRNPDMQTALRVVQAYGHDIRVLGSYAAQRNSPAIC